MSAYFLDTSALVKRYVVEIGTSWVRNLSHRNTGHQIFLARITAVEVTAAVAHRRRRGDVSASEASSILSRFRMHLVLRYTIIELTPAVTTGAMRCANTHKLRAYDAVQLATAMELNRLSQGASPLCLLIKTSTKQRQPKGLLLKIQPTTTEQLEAEEG